MSARANGVGGSLSETRVGRSDRVVRGNKELLEKLGRRKGHPQCGHGTPSWDSVPPLRAKAPIPHLLRLHRQLVTHAGLSPAEAIASATRNAAEALGIAQDYGTVEVGRIADLLVLAADPALDVRNTRRPLMVFKGGHLAYERPGATPVPAALLKERASTPPTAVQP